MPGILQQWWWRPVDDWRVEIKRDNKSTVWEYYYYYYYHGIVWNGKPQSLHAPIAFLPHTRGTHNSTYMTYNMLLLYYSIIVPSSRPVPSWLPSSPPSFFIARSQIGGDSRMAVTGGYRGRVMVCNGFIIRTRMMRIMTERRGEWVVQYDRVGEGERTR